MISDDAQPVCLLCKPGYTMNQLKICDQITVPNCSEFVNFIPSDKKSIANVYFYVNGFEGCKRCLNTHLKVEVNPLNDVSNKNLVIPTQQCIHSEYFLSRFQFGGTFPANCEYFSLNNKCASCREGFIYMIQDNSCYDLSNLTKTLSPNTKLLNCLVALKEDECHIC